MQLKHLIIFALVGMVLLLGFNLINGSRQESRQAALLNSSVSDGSAIDRNDSDILNDNMSSSTNINSKPLGEQPKAMLDKATTQIDQAQQSDKERFEHLE